MNTQSQVTPELRPYVEIINGKIKTTSLKVAEHFNKRHDNVLEKIKKLDCSDEFRSLNFKESFYEQKIPNGAAKNVICYEMTRDGFTFLAMGFTSKQAAQWKESYINAFNVMAEQIHQPQYGLKELPEPNTKTALPGGLTLEQQDVIKALVKQNAETLPKDKQAGATIKQWAAIKKKFSLTKKQTYKEISPDSFVDVVSLLARLPLEGELLPKDDQAKLTHEVDFLQREHMRLSDELAKCFTVDLSAHEGLERISLKFKTTGYLYGRWTLTLSDGEFIIKAMQEGEFLTTSEKLSGQIGDSMGGAVKSQHLTDIIKAAIDRIQRHKQ